MGAQKNDLIVEAVRFWKKRRNQYRLESAYKALNEGDKKELAAIADEGLADWVE